MADIDVVKGRSSNNWIWWVVAAVVVVLALMFLVRRNDDTKAPARSPSSSMAPTPASSALVA